MRILHVAETLKGGIATYVNELIDQQLLSSAITQIMVCYPAEHESELLIPYSNRLPISKPDRGILNLFKFGRGCVNAIKKHNPDIIHLHSTFSGFILRILLLFYRTNAKIVYCSHGWSFLSECSFYKRYFFLLIELALQITTSKIINISKYEHNRALGYGFSKTKSILIVNAIAPPPAASALPENYKLHKYNFLFVGRLDRQKGYDIFLEIAKIVSQKNLDIGFHLVGDSVVSAGDLFDQSTVNIPRLYQYGWLERANLFNFFHYATALIMPSRWEGFGLVAIESLACKCPVIVSDRGALPDIMHEFPFLVFSIENFVDGTCDLIINDIDKIRTVDIDNKAILDAYSIQRLADQVFDVYQSVLKAE